MRRTTIDRPVKPVPATRPRRSQAVEAHAWDGEWYLRAFYDDGNDHVVVVSMATPDRSGA